MRKRLTFRGVDVYEGTYSEWEEDEQGWIIGPVLEYGADGTLLGEAVRVGSAPCGADYIKAQEQAIKTTPQYEGLWIEVTED